jgi:hypothetical protein
MLNCLTSGDIGQFANHLETLKVAKILLSWLVAYLPCLLPYPTPH